MSCWFIKKNKPFQFIKNDLCRRQDFPAAYSHHHYICGFNVKYLNKLNNELISTDTFPLLLNSKTSNKLIEVDTPEELKRFKRMIKNEKPKIDNSNKLYKRAIKIIPGGSQTFSKGPSQFTNNFAPKYLKKGKGCKVWDEDNNVYVDYVMGCQPLILGYSDKDVNNAVQKQLKIGSTFSLMNKLEIDVAELLVKHIPSAEMVRFEKWRRCNYNCN